MTGYSHDNTQRVRQVFVLGLIVAGCGLPSETPCSSTCVDLNGVYNEVSQSAKGYCGAVWSGFTDRVGISQDPDPKRELQLGTPHANSLPGTLYEDLSASFSLDGYAPGDGTSGSLTLKGKFSKDTAGHITFKGTYYYHPNIYFNYYPPGLPPGQSPPDCTVEAATSWTLSAA